VQNPTDMKSKATVERVPRQVVENKLLAALDDADNNQVAIILKEEDLSILICALRKYRTTEAQQMVEDFLQLKRLAFTEQARAE